MYYTIYYCILIYISFYSVRMGCGACISQTMTEQPTEPLISISTIALNLITRYEQHVQVSSNNINQNGNESHGNQQIKIDQLKLHPALSLQECKTIADAIAVGDIWFIQPLFLSELQPQSTKQETNANAPAPLLNTVSQILWKCLLLLPEHTISPKTNPIDVPVFKKIVKNEQEIVQNSFYQISLDVNRTFPKNAYLQPKRTDLTLLLRNVVNAMPGIGYTQGMNFYCGFLLLCGFTAQQAYYLIIQLFTNRNFFLCHNFTPTFSLSQSLNELLSHSLSLTLSTHLTTMGITQQIYSLSWFLCSFLYTLEPRTCVLIWDYMIKSGIAQYQGGGVCTIANVAIGVMKILQENIIQYQSPELILMELKNDNLNKLITRKQINSILAKINKYNAIVNKNPDFFVKYQKKNKKSKGHSFRKHFITRKQLLQYDKQLRNALTKKQGYEKYMKQIFGWVRFQKEKGHDKIQEIIHVGKPKNSQNIY